MMSESGSGAESGAFRVRRTCREENLKTFLPAANKMGLSGYPCSKVLEKELEPSGGACRGERVGC